MINKYNQKTKEKLQKEALERYQSLSEEEKEKKLSTWEIIAYYIKLTSEVSIE